MEEIKNEKKDRLVNNFIDYKSACSSFMNSEFEHSDFLKDIITQFDANCKDKFYCDLEFKLNLLKGACHDHLMNEVKLNKN